MVNIPVIAKRELCAFFLSPVAYVVLVLFAVVHAIFFLAPLALSGVGPDQVALMDANHLAARGFQIAVYLLVVFAPIITMGLFSEEYASGTVERLLTSPVSTLEIVLGKYLGALIFAMTMLAPVALECVFLLSLGGVDYGPVASGLLGVYLVTALFLAVGLFCSSLTRLQIASALSGIVLLVLLQFLWLLVGTTDSPAAALLRYLPPAAHVGDMLAGLVSTRDLVYFVAATGLFVFLSILALDARRLEGMFAGGRRAPWWKTLSRVGIALGLVLVAATVVVGDVAAQSLARPGRLPAALKALQWAGWLVAGLCIALNHDALVRFVRRRRSAAAANLVISGLLAVALAALVCCIGARRCARIDMTGKRVYSVSQKTRRMLRGLDRPVRVSAVYYRPGKATYEQAHQHAMRMLSQFTFLSPMVSVQQVGLHDRSKIADLRDRVGELPEQCYVFEADGVSDVVGLRELVHISKLPGAPPVFVGESAFASAVAKVMDRRRRVVCLLTDHGSPAFSLLADALKRDNFDCRPPDFAPGVLTPADCSALIVAGRRSALPEEHVEIIRTYLRAGGRVLLLVDSRAGADAPLPGLDRLLSEYGVRLRLDVMGMYRRGKKAARPVVPVTGDGFAAHPATRDLVNYTVALTRCGAVEVTSPEPQRGLIARVVMTGISPSWGEKTVQEDMALSEFDRDDMPGPLPVAAVVQPLDQNAPGPRLFVVAAAEAFADEQLTARPENLYLLLNAVNWMTGRKRMLGIPSKDMQLSRVALSAAHMRGAGWAFLVLIPLSIALMGAAVWVMRRR